MPCHDPVDPHRLNRFRRVNDGLALRDAAATAAKLNRIRPQAFCSQRKTVPRSRTVLKEQIGTRLTRQKSQFMPTAPRGLFHPACHIQQSRNFLCRQPFQL